MRSVGVWGLSVAAAIQTASAARSPTLTLDLAAGALHPHASPDHPFAQGGSAAEDLPQWTKVRPKFAKIQEQPESLLMRGFRFILSGLGSSAEANLALKRAKNELLQEHVQALHDHGYYACAAPGHSSSNSTNSSSLMQVETESKVQTHLSAMSQAQLEAFAKQVLAEFHGQAGPSEDEDDDDEDAEEDAAGDNEPRRQPPPEGITEKAMTKITKAWSWFGKKVSGGRKHANRLANVFSVFGNSCMTKLLFAFYKHEGEDDYPYFPRGCVDSWGEVMAKGDAFRAATCAPRTLLLFLGAVLSLRATSARD